MSLNIMIKTIKRVLIVPLLAALLSGQESLFWEIADPIVNSEFIESYINRLSRWTNLKKMPYRHRSPL